MSEARSPARDNFVGQAEACRRLGSPFTAALCELLAERLDDSSRFGARLLNWPATASDDALALRAAGALHALARSGGVPELSRAYPPHPFDKERLWAGIAAAMVSHDAFLHDYLDSPPQTNEVARSAILLGGYLELARAFGLPFQVLELGSSAGLNLLVDQYRYDLGRRAIGATPRQGW